MRVLLFPILFLLAGCVNVPKTIITYSPGPIGGSPTFKIAAPKNVDIQGLEYTRTNNVVSLKIQSYRAKMDPDVISASAAGQVEIIGAVGNVVGNATAAALSAYTSGGTSLVAPKKPSAPATNALPPNVLPQ